ncbi:hypothetical protein DXB97_01100 [Firmicutes bacterium OM07-11]|nr:hypothetical protein DXB97_01100 [Firmicutes bacterium OM07-11]
MIHPFVHFASLLPVETWFDTFGTFLVVLEKAFQKINRQGKWMKYLERFASFPEYSKCFEQKLAFANRVWKDKVLFR